MIGRLSLAAGLLLALAMVAGCGGDDDGSTSTPSPSASPEQSASPSPSLSPSLTPTASPSLDPLTLSAPIDLPSDYAFIVETGCWQCDGPALSFVRVYSDPATEQGYVADILFDPAAMGVTRTYMENGQPVEGPSYIAGAIFDEQARRIIISACVFGECVSVDERDPNAQVKLFRSDDGGVSWEEFDLDADGYAIGLLPDGKLLIERLDDPRESRTEGEEPFHHAWSIWPGGEAVEPPNGDHTLSPRVLDDGEIIWFSETGDVLLKDGQLLATLFVEVGEPVYATSVLGDLKGGIIVTWVRQPWRPIDEHLVYVTGIQPSEGGPITYEASSSDLFSSGAWLQKQGWLIGNATWPGAGLFGFAPAIIDTVTRIISPIPEPFTSPDFIYPNPRNLVRAVQVGPFARVTGTGSCLNVRAEPSIAGQVLDCMADGVLLRADNPGWPGEGWQQVITPAGIDGFASMLYLDIVGQ